MKNHRSSSSMPPALLPALLACSIALSSSIRAAVTNGTVVAWATNLCLPANPPATLTNVAAMAMGQCHGLALLNDGRVVGWGSDLIGQATPPPSLSGVRAIAAGANHSLALKSNGTVVAWGDNSGFQTNVPVWLAGVQAIAAGTYHSLALLSNGTVAAWGTGPAAAIPFINNVVAIAGGGSHSMALFANGTVFCWGQNFSGQLNVPTGLDQVVAIAAGGSHSLALRLNGTVVAWGAGQFAPPWQSYVPPGLTGVIGIAAGETHSLALLANRRVYGWGDPYEGKTDTSGLSNVVAISTKVDVSAALIVHPAAIPPAGHPQGRTVMAGADVAFSVVASGSPPLSYQWRKEGTNIAGATNASYALNNAQMSDAGTYTVVVTNLTGSVTSSNAVLVVNSPPVITHPPASQSAVTLESVTFTVGAIGTAPLHYRWRHNGVSLGAPNSSNYTISVVFTNHAGDYTVVVTNAFGAVTSAVATLVVNSPPAITQQPQSRSVIAGVSVTFTVQATGATGYQWRKNGVNIDGATMPFLTFTSVQPSDAATYTVLVTNQYGSTLSAAAVLAVNAPPPSSTRVAGWGQTLAWNGSAWVDVTPPIGLANAVALAAGSVHSLALINNGTVVGWGDNSSGQADPPPGLNGVEEIAAGGRHSLALTNHGVVAWGENDFGQATPPVAAAQNVVAVAAGGNHSLALHRDGRVLGWGANNWGQIIPPPAVTNVMAIAAGFEHSFVLRSNGTVAVWGRNTEYQNRIPPELTSAATAGIAAIAAGGYHCLALRSNGTVVAWGSNQFGQTNVPPGLSGVIALAAGENHSLALKSDGTVVGWGLDNEGQTDVPPDLSGVVAIAAGGNRSLALVRKGLVAGRPQWTAQGFSLVLANSDGSPVGADRLSKVNVRATTDLAAPPGAWVNLNHALSLTGNVIRLLDTNSVGLPHRFYRITENP